MTPGGAWALREELKALTPKPVRYVINTHWHWDHAHGNQIYGPDVEIIGHQYTRAKTTDAAERGTLAQQVEMLDTQLEGTKSIAVKPPTVTLSDHLTLFRGGREIRLLHLGRAHTGGDVVVHLPKERVVITGDLLVEGTSYLGDGFLAEWPQTLERLARIDYFQACLRDFWTQAQALHKAGVSAEDAAKRMDMRTHVAHYPALTTTGVLWHGVARAYEEIEGRAQ